MDKTWMEIEDRRTTEYQAGVDEFLKFAKSNVVDPRSFRCPCQNCGNMFCHSPNVIRLHLFSVGMDKSYTKWIEHGELDVETDEEMDIDDNECDGGFGNIADMVEDAYKYAGDDPEALKKHIEDAEKPLYADLTHHTKLSALVKLLTLKGRFGWSDVSVSALLTTVKDLLPPNNELPDSIYEAEKTMSALSLKYEKIHACENDCILYRGDYKDENKCPKCKLSRWKKEKVNESATKKINRVPVKVLWYFPIIPRFQRMFQSPQTARDLTWHENGREIDDKLRHPADSPSWKAIDHTWPDFAAEPRNIRLALAADGINPHGNQSTRYSCWPVILIAYNLPPWLCMKRKFMMLSLLISGPRQPGNDIDVYLAPLVEDLKRLWEVGVDTYDAHEKKNFCLRAILLWTINDFPAYGNLCGCVMKGSRASPICGEGTYSIRLKHSQKNVYMGHRQFLPTNHKFRKQKSAFFGGQDFEKPPQPLTGEEVLERVSAITTSWGKTIKKKKVKATVGGKKKFLGVKVGRKRLRQPPKPKKPKHPKNGKKEPKLVPYWKKKSIFFDLEYWKDMHVRHQLDVMHIEKNVCESIFGTLLNIPGKRKDNVKARMDMKAMEYKPLLAPKTGNVKNKKGTTLPASTCTMTKEEKETFCQTLFDLKVPDGYCSNFKNLVSMSDYKLYGLKSHDCHILMQQLLPFALRSVMQKPVRYAIIRFCFFFNALCSKVVDVDTLGKLQSDLVVTLCLLEKYFPPSFFDVMVHLTVHLVREVRLCGPVYLRWMYPFERYMKVLKGYVRNHYRPEGCIAECYIAEETLEFCTDYVSGLNPIRIPREKATAMAVGVPLPGGHLSIVDQKLLDKAHHYVLENADIVQRFIEMHMEELKKVHPRESKKQQWLLDKHMKYFVHWLPKRVAECISNGESIPHSLECLAEGPSPHVTKYQGYDIKGYRFHTKDRDDNRVTQNSGVSVVAESVMVSSSKDKNPIVGNVCYYGVIKEIWELHYQHKNVGVFMCDWVDIHNGVIEDELGTIVVNRSKLGHKSEPFIMASQVKQVFYVADQLNLGWSLVGLMPDRDFKQKEGVEESKVPEDVPFVHTKMPDIDLCDMEDDESNYLRTDCEDVVVDDADTK